MRQTEGCRSCSHVNSNMFGPNHQSWQGECGYCGVTSFVSPSNKLSGDFCSARKTACTLCGCPANASCTPGQEYTCNSCYYKVAGGCAACKANSTCTSSTNFTCNWGFYKSSSQCNACPSDATCSNNEICCNENYYKNGNACKACPSGKTTKGQTCRTSSASCKV